MSNKTVVTKVANAFLAKDIDTVLANMTDDVQMGWPGYFDLAPGKDAVRQFFSNVPELVWGRVGHMVEEGNKIAATGTVTSKEQDGSLKNSFFCDWYEIENGKVKSITSYMIFEQKKP